MTTDPLIQCQNGVARKIWHLLLTFVAYPYLW